MGDVFAPAPILGLDPHRVFAETRGGALGISHGADAVRAGGELELDGPNGKPATHTLPTWIGPGVLALAFALTLVNFLRGLGADFHDPTVIHYWTWMATGTFSVDVALQIDPLSIIMMMVIFGGLLVLAQGSAVAPFIYTIF